MDAHEIGVIFDCDGTLVDSMSAWRELEAELARQAGATLTREDVDLLTTLSIPECGRFIHEQLGLGASSAEVVDTIDAFMLDFYANRSTLREGAGAFVEGLAACGVPMAVASSTPQALVEVAMRHTGIDGMLRTIVSVDALSSSKRSPEVYDLARASLGTERACTWGFEDTVYALRTLRLAGYRTMGVYDCDLSGTFEQLCGEADAVVRSFTELDAERFLASARDMASA